MGTQPAVNRIRHIHGDKDLFAKVYITDVTALEDPELFDRLYGRMPRYRREKTDRTRFDRDRRLSLGAGALLLHALDETGAEADGGEQLVSLAGRLCSAVSGIGTGEHGKPYLPDRPGIEYNLSHSGDLAMCIVSDCPAGCDVQIYRPNYMDIARRFFFGREYELIESQPSEKKMQEIFFRLWTLKESFMKVTGLGFALPLQDFSMEISGEDISVSQHIDDAKYSFFEYNYRDGYSVSCALRGYEGEKPQLQTVDLTAI